MRIEPKTFAELKDDILPDLDFTINCQDNYCYFVALLILFNNTIKPAIHKRNKVEFALQNLAADLESKDVELAKLVRDLDSKVLFYYARKDSYLAGQYVKGIYGRIHRRLFELIQMDGWRLEI